MMPGHVGTRWAAPGWLARSSGAALLTALLAWPGGGAMAQEAGRITGEVIDGSTGAPLAGVQIVLEGTSYGTVTNGRGRYLVLNVPAGTYTVAVELIGYGRESAEVGLGAGQVATANFELFTQAISLESVIVTGTAGQARRREVGTSVSQITAQDIEASAIVDVADVMQGRAAGVTVRDFGGGQAGAGSNISIRGVNTVGGSRPLIYVDGVRMQTREHGEPDEANVAATPLDDLDPSTIERIEIVKGAAATTLYGTEASAGVIQIFTKRGGGAAGARTAGPSRSSRAAASPATWGPRRIRRGST